MNVKERVLVKELLESINIPSVAVAGYGPEGREELLTHEEASRLLDSADYKKGWAACGNQVRNTLAYMLSQQKKRR